jgi:hypothetical protein
MASEYKDFFQSYNDTLYFHPYYVVKITDELIEYISNSNIKKIVFINNSYDSMNDVPIPIKKTFISYSWIKSEFNLDIDLSKCLKLREIYLGKSFNKDISNIPKTIEILYFGDDFNQPINFLPFNLLKLKFGNHLIKS